MQGPHTVPQERKRGGAVLLPSILRCRQSPCMQQQQVKSMNGPNLKMNGPNLTLSSDLSISTHRLHAVLMSLAHPLTEPPGCEGELQTI